jgi:Cd2+/Zn2+-exporting ATPase
MKNVEETQIADTSTDEHGHEHEHDHEHGKLPVILYFIGFILAIVAFFLSEGYGTLKNIFFSLTVLTAGYHVVFLEGLGETIENTRENKHFTPNSHVLMGLAALGAMLIGSYGEGALLILIFAGAHFLEHYAEGKSKREISQLLEMNPTNARLLLPDGRTKSVAVEQLKIGDQLKVLNGDQVPIDGVILAGSTTIDESSINGESIPQEKTKDDVVFGSTINGSGTFTMEVTKESNETVFAKILQLVNQNQENQTQAASMIQKFEPKYVTFVLVAIALFMLVTPLVSHWTYAESIYRGLVILVAASPCALAAATVSVTLSATSKLAKKGVLSKGSTYLAEFAEIDAIAFDKTGTLTYGKPEVTDYFFAETVAEDDLIDIIVALEKEANHPLADAILRKFQAKNTLALEVNNHIGTGVTGTYNNKDYRIGKPTAFEKIPTQYEELKNKWSAEGKTVIYVAEEEQVVGVIALLDIPHQQAQDTIDYFKKQGVHTTLITGDAERAGQAVAEQLGLDEVIANVMPEDKADIIQQQKEKYGVTAMVGDGVNDAPALVNANVGIAMGEGTDVAVEVSDLVLMQNHLSKLVELHQTASKMQRVIRQNIFFAVGVAAFLVVVSALGLTDMTLSVIVHEGSTFIVILNGLRLLQSN